MFINILLAFVSYFCFSFLTSFGIIMPLIVVRVSYPLIRYLEARGMIKAAPARKRNRLTILIWATIDAVFVCAIVLINNVYVFAGAAIGFLFTFIRGFSKTGLNEKNLQDFVRSYGNLFLVDPEYVYSEITELVFRGRE